MAGSSRQAVITRFFEPRPNDIVTLHDPLKLTPAHLAWYLDVPLGLEAYIVRYFGGKKDSFEIYPDLHERIWPYVCHYWTVYQTNEGRVQSLGQSLDPDESPVEFLEMRCDWYQVPKKKKEDQAMSTGRSRRSTNRPNERCPALAWLEMSYDVADGLRGRLVSVHFRSAGSHNHTRDQFNVEVMAPRLQHPHAEIPLGAQR